MTQANSADPDQSPHNVVSNQDLHCLLSECSVKIKKKKEKISPNTPKIGRRIILLITEGKSIRLKCVNVFTMSVLSDEISLATLPMTVWEWICVWCDQCLCGEF